MLLPKTGLKHLSSILHEGKTLLFATADGGAIYYTVKQDGFEDTVNPETLWEEWQPLPLPTSRGIVFTSQDFVGLFDSESDARSAALVADLRERRYLAADGSIGEAFWPENPAGFSFALDDSFSEVTRSVEELLERSFRDRSVVDHDAQERTKSDGSPLLRSLYQTERLTADAAVKLVSSSGHLYVFRQSTSHRLLVDRFVLDAIANRLTRKIEVRFRRSRQRFEPISASKIGGNGKQNQMDSLDFRDVDGSFFYEPTTEITVAGAVHKGRFAVVQTPSHEPDRKRWHIFTSGADAGTVLLTTLSSTREGLFELRDRRAVPTDGPHSLLNGIRQRSLQLKDAFSQRLYLRGALEATGFDEQAEQQTRSGTHLLRTGARVLLACPVLDSSGDGAGVASVIFTVAADGSLSETNEAPNAYEWRANERGLHLPADMLDHIRAQYDTSPLPQGAVTGVRSSTHPLHEDKVVVSTRDISSSGDTQTTNRSVTNLRFGDTVELLHTAHYDGLYRVQSVDDDSFVIEAPYVDDALGRWRKVEEESAGLVFDGMMTAIEAMPPSEETTSSSDSGSTSSSGTASSGTGTSGTGSSGTSSSGTGSGDNSSSSSSSGGDGSSDTTSSETSSGDSNEPPTQLRVTAFQHGLRAGDEVQITGTRDHNGDYSVVKLDDDSFTIDRRWTRGEAVNVRRELAKRRGLTFGSPEDRLEIPPTQHLDFSSDFTVESWLRLAAHSHGAVSDDSGSSGTGGTDSGGSDSGESDSGESDSGGSDSGESDSGESDSGESDSGGSSSGGSGSGGSDSGGSSSGGSGSGGSDSGGSSSGGSGSGGSESRAATEHVVCSVGDAWSLAIACAGETITLHFHHRAANSEARSDLEKTIPRTNDWLHVAAVVDGRKKHLFVNGESVASADLTGPIASPRASLLIGNKARPGSQGDSFESAGAFVGELSDFRVWSTARTAREIQAQRQVQLTGEETHLAGSWRLGGIAEDDGRHVVDFSPFGHSAEVHGTPSVGIRELPRAAASDAGLLATAYSNENLVAVTAGAKYVETVDVKLNPVGDPNAIDGTSNNFLWAVHLWGKKARGDVERVEFEPDDPGDDDQFDALGETGWYRFRCSFTVPAGVRMIRHFGVQALQGTWTSLQLRNHRLSMLSDVVTARVSDDELLLPLSGHSRGALATERARLGVLLSQEERLLQEQRKLAADIALAADASLSSALLNIERQTRDSLIEEIRVHQAVLDDPLHYRCFVTCLDNDRLLMALTHPGAEESETTRVCAPASTRLVDIPRATLEDYYLFREDNGYARMLWSFEKYEKTAEDRAREARTEEVEPDYYVLRNAFSQRVLISSGRNPQLVQDMPGKNRSSRLWSIEKRSYVVDDESKVGYLLKSKEEESYLEHWLYTVIPPPQASPSFLAALARLSGSAGEQIRSAHLAQAQRHMAIMMGIRDWDLWRADLFEGHFRDNVHTDNSDLDSCLPEKLWRLWPTGIVAPGSQRLVEEARTKIDENEGPLAEARAEVARLEDEQDTRVTRSRDVWRPRLEVVEAELEALTAPLQAAHERVLRLERQMGSAPLEMPLLRDSSRREVRQHDSRGLATQGAVLEHLDDAVDLSVLESCEGSVVLSYRGHEGRFRSPSYDATSDSRNTTVDQWIPQQGQAALTFNEGRAASSSVRQKAEIPKEVFADTASGLTIELWARSGSTPLTSIEPADLDDFEEGKVFENRGLSVQPNALLGGIDDEDATQIQIAFVQPRGSQKAYVRWLCGRDDAGFDVATGQCLAAATYYAKWNHWAFTKDFATGTMEIFLNGQRISAVGSGNGSGGTARIRRLPQLKSVHLSHGGSWCGRVSEVRIWSDVLEPREIRVNSRTELSGNEPLLAAYYPMGSASWGVDGQVLDHGPSGMHLTGIASETQRTVRAPNAPEPGVAWMRTDLDDVLRFSNIDFDLRQGMTIEGWFEIADNVDSYRLFFLDEFEDVSDSTAVGKKFLEYNMAPDGDDVAGSTMLVSAVEAIESSGNRRAGSTRRQSFAPQLRGLTHLCIRLDAESRLRILVNGIPEHNREFHASYLDGFRATKVHLLGVARWFARFAEVRIWDRFRTREQVVESLYRQLDVEAEKERGLVLYLGEHPRSGRIVNLVTGEEPSTSAPATVSERGTLVISEVTKLQRSPVVRFTRCDEAPFYTNREIDVTEGLTFEGWIRYAPQRSTGRGSLNRRIPTHLLELKDTSYDASQDTSSQGSSGSQGEDPGTLVRLTLDPDADSTLVLRLRLKEAGAAWSDRNDIHYRISLSQLEEAAHVAVTLDAHGRTCAYLNGVRVEALVLRDNASLEPVATTLLSVCEGRSLDCVGLLSQPTHFAAVREHRFWNTCRTAEQIKANYKRSLFVDAEKDAGLLVYLPFDQSTNALNDKVQTDTATRFGDALTVYSDRWSEVQYELGSEALGCLIEPPTAEEREVRTEGRSFAKLAPSTDTALVLGALEIDWTQGITFECFLKHSFENGECQLLSLRKDDPRKSLSLSFYRGNDVHSGAVRVSLSEGSRNVDTVLRCNLDESLNHLAVVVDPRGTLKVYLSGEFQGSCALGNNHSSGGATYSSLTSDFSVEVSRFLGTLSREELVRDVRLWNSVRTREQIANFRNVRLNAESERDNGLLAYFPLDSDDWPVRDFVSGRAVLESENSSSLTVSRPQDGRLSNSTVKRSDYAFARQVGNNLNLQFQDATRDLGIDIADGLSIEYRAIFGSQFFYARTLIGLFSVSYEREDGSRFKLAIHLRPGAEGTHLDAGQEGTIHVDVDHYDGVRRDVGWDFAREPQRICRLTLSADSAAARALRSGSPTHFAICTTRDSYWVLHINGQPFELPGSRYPMNPWADLNRRSITKLLELHLADLGSLQGVRDIAVFNSVWGQVRTSNLRGLRFGDELPDDLKLYVPLHDAELPIKNEVNDETAFPYVGEGDVRIETLPVAEAIFGPASVAPRRVTAPQAPPKKQLGAPLTIAEYPRVIVRDGTRSSMMFRLHAFVTEDGVEVFEDKRVEELDLLWVGNAQINPTLLGYIEGAPPVPNENLTEDDDYTGASSVALTRSEELELSWERDEESTAGFGIDGFFGIDKNTDIFKYTGGWFGGGAGGGVAGAITVSGGQAGAIVQASGITFKGGVQAAYAMDKAAFESTEVGTSSGQVTTDRLDLVGAPEQIPRFKHLGRRFLPKNVGYALVISGTADVFIQRLKRSRRMVGYKILPVPDIPLDINTITFLINPTYTLNGSLDGMTGTRGATRRFHGHVPKMRSQLGSLYPASYFRVLEAYDLKRQIEQQDKERQAYFAQFDARKTSKDYLDEQLEKDEHVQGVSMDRARNLSESGGEGSESSSSEEGEAEERELEQEVSGSADEIIERIEAEMDSASRQEHAKTMYLDWQRRMEKLKVLAGKRNIVNTYVWDADGGFHSQEQQIASVVTHSMGGSLLHEWTAGNLLEFSGFDVAAELSKVGNFSLTQTMSKTEVSSTGIELEVDLDGVESTGVTDNEDRPLLPGEKVDRYRFMSFYLENQTDHWHDFFDYVVDPEWLQSNDEEARALRMAQLGAPNAAWRVLHRVTYVARPALLGFGRDVRGIIEQEDSRETTKLLEKLEEMDSRITTITEIVEALQAAQDDD